MTKNIAAWLVVFLAVACTDREPEQAASTSRSPNAGISTALAVAVPILRAERTVRTPEAIGQRAAVLASILLDRPVAPPAFVAVETSARHQQAPVAVDIAPELVTMYRPAYDDLRVTHRRFLRDDAVPPSVTRDQALEVAKNALAVMLERGLVDDDFDMANAHVGERKFFSGPIGREAALVTNEYRFTAWPKVNGIRNACSRVRIGVHKSGRLSFLAVMSTCALESTTSSRPIQVTEAQAQERFTKDFSTARGAKWSTVYTPLDKDFDTALLEPVHVVQFATVSTSDGHEVISRKRILAYSATYPERTPTELGPAPDPDAQGDPR